MFNLYADVDARSMTPSRNTRSYTLRSVPSFPGRSFFLFYLLSHELVVADHPVLRTLEVRTSDKAAQDFVRRQRARMAE